MHKSERRFSKESPTGSIRAEFLGVDSGPLKILAAMWWSFYRTVTAAGLRLLFRPGER